ncbi:MAG: FkbM family methyltransferase [Magnetococcales bacterium]|nr:FkbM family methyltransferase [Magnetococcales bacterium]
MSSHTDPQSVIGSAHPKPEDHLQRKSFKITGLLIRLITRPFGNKKRWDLMRRFYEWFLPGGIADTRRGDGKWLCVPFHDVAHLLYGADYKRFNKNNFYPVVREVVKPGQIAIDIGAAPTGGGDVLELAEQVGESGRVYSFEPDPLSCEALERTLLLNGVENVSCYQVALGNDPSSEEGGAPLTEIMMEPRSGNGAISVPFTTLDRFWKEHIYPKKIDFIKIDTDGFELSILEGAKEVMAHNPDIQVLSEYTPGISYDGLTGKKTLDAYRKMGFDLHMIQTAIKPLHEDQDTYLMENMSNPLHMICHDLVLTRRGSTSNTPDKPS